MKLRTLKARKPLEREIQKGIIRLFRSCGGVVYSTSQGYRSDPGGTRMTPGLSDVIAFFPRKSRLLFFEVKRPGEVRTQPQVVFGNTVEEVNNGVVLPGVWYGWGAMEEAMVILRTWGLVT